MKLPSHDKYPTRLASQGDCRVLMYGRWWGLKGGPDVPHQVRPTEPGSLENRGGEVKIVKVVREVEVPDDATHYAGDILSDDVTWFKVTQIGAAGDHWWCRSSESETWKFVGHGKPHWIQEVPS